MRKYSAGRVGRSATGARPLAALLAVLTLGLLTACVGIPNSGGVSQGIPLDAGSEVGNIAFNPEGPEPGATQQSILKGFVASFTSATGGYAVAKSFLSRDFADKWDPRASVQVRSSAPRLITVDDSTIQYSFTAIANVDKTGAYAESSASATLPFGFVRERGQWRISAAPDGIVLADQTFERIFSQHTLYFLDSTSTHLVPDVRWFPSGTAATRIVSALFAGPPDWLKGAAFSRFPDGTALSDSGTVITPEDGVARIDLTKEALTASPKQRQLMKLQLTKSLLSIGSISSVAISVEGTPLPIDDLGADAPQADSKVDSQALVLRKKEFGFYANDRVAALGTLSAKVVALDPSAATLSSDQATVAVLGPAGVSVARKSAATATVDARPDLIPPSLDEAGYTWSVPSTDPNAITAFDPAGVAHSVMAGLPPSGAEITSLEVSREGARILMFLSTPNGPRLIVAAILRDEKQVPVSIGTPIVDVTIDEGAPVDATWVDQSTVASLVTIGGQSRVELYSIGGKRTSLNSLSEAKQIVGGNRSVDGLWVRGADSSIWSYRGSSWQNSKIIVSFIASQR